MPSPQDVPEEEHPSYATIQVGRASGRTYLFDSEAEHHNFIHLSITRASVQRHLAGNWINPRTQLIEIAMSEAQWAHFVSSMNLGAGTPCTLRRFKGEVILETPAPKSTADTFGNDMRETLREYETHLNELDALVAKMQAASTPSKKDLAKLAHELSIVRGRFQGNSKFVAEQFGEHIEETMLRARQEIEAYFVNRVQQLGLAAQAAQMPVSLPGSVPEASDMTDDEVLDLANMAKRLRDGDPEAWNHLEKS